MKLLKNKIPILVEIADSNFKRQNGLMFRKSIPDNYGMLFSFDEPQVLKFWGMNTFIPLDICFLDENFVVKSISSIKPHDLNSISSDCPCKFALETNLGFLDKYGIKNGTKLKLWKDGPSSFMDLDFEKTDQSEKKKDKAEEENWDSQMAGDDEGNVYSVKNLYDYASQVTGEPVMIPIEHTDGIEWWHKSYSLKNPDDVNRMQNADTSFPVLAVEYGRYRYTIPDGLNRIMKAHSVEGKKHVPALVLSREQFDDFKYMMRRLKNIEKTAQSENKKDKIEEEVEENKQKEISKLVEEKSNKPDAETGNIPEEDFDDTPESKLLVDNEKSTKPDVQRQTTEKIIEENDTNKLKKYPKFSSFFDALRWSYANGEVIRIFYKTLNGNRIVRDVEPHGLFKSRKSGRQVLVTFDRNVNQPRSYIAMNVNQYSFIGRKYQKKFIFT